jgi:hypothetical protein
LGGQIEKNEMGGACSIYWGEQRCVLVFGGEIDYLENPGVDGRIILRWIFRKWNGGMDGFDLTQGQVVGSCKRGFHKIREIS